MKTSALVVYFIMTSQIHSFIWLSFFIHISTDKYAISGTSYVWNKIIDNSIWNFPMILNFGITFSCLGIRLYNNTKVISFIKNNVNESLAFFWKASALKMNNQRISRHFFLMKIALEIENWFLQKNNFQNPSKKNYHRLGIS